MVKIAIAGGSGQIARNVIDVLIATQKHDLLVLSRQNHVGTESIPGVTFIKVDYTDKTHLVKVLSGVHTVLSFTDVVKDVGSVSQKGLIDAAVEAGVKRFAPSEWSTSSIEDLPWYAEKGTIRSYLEEINKDKKILEYSLFQVGLALDLFSPPGPVKYLKPVELPIDFVGRRAIVLKGHDPILTLTSTNDVAHIVARAVEYEGEWPIIGGIQGTTLPTSKILEIGTKVRGGISFETTTLEEEDLRAGIVKAPWVPRVAPTTVPKDIAESFSKVITIGFLLSGIHSAWAVSDEWNKIFPDYKFEGAEEFIAKDWAGVS